MRASRGSDPSPPAQAPESPYFPRFEAELGEMRENGPRQPFPWFPRVTQGVATPPKKKPGLSHPPDFDGKGQAPP
jgi:hypothetical protein